MQPRYLTGLLVVVALTLGLPLVAQAVPVGRFVQVEGSVDLMKGGKFPAVPVKLQDAVEQGDAVRTKSLSRAQIQFVDDTLLTLAPESRVAINEYVYDGAHGKRQATVEIFRGLVHFVVTKILQAEPDFIMKTQTGVLGVRGTRWYAQLTPLHTDIYNEQGTTEVHNLFPEVPGKVTLTGMQFTRVGFNLPPTLPLPITMQDLQEMRMQFSTPKGGAGDHGAVSPLDTGALGTNPALGPGVGIVGPGPGGGTVNDPVYNPTFSLYTNNNLVNNPANNPLIPSPPPPPGPISSTYAFTMDLYGYRTNTISSPGNAISTSANWGLLTGVDPEYFTTSGSGTRASASFTGPTGTANTFTASDILSGTVSGVSGQSLTGTFSGTWNTSTGYTGTFSGPITINPNGTFNFSYNNLSGSNGTYTVTGTGSSSGTPGTYFTQTAVGSVAMTGNAAGNQQTFTNTSDTINGAYPIYGTRTGVYPGTFAATFNMTSTAPVSGFYPPADQGSLAATMQGVVSGLPGGTQTGVMTTVAGGQGENSTPNTFAGPVTINSDGSLSASFYGTNTSTAVSPAPAGIFTQQGTWTQTATLTAPTGGSYSFSIPLTDSDYITPTSNAQATVSSNSVGTQTGVFPGTYLGSVTNGTLTGSSGSFTVGNTVSNTITGTLSVAVSGVLGGYTLSGTGTFTGTSASGQTVNYTGPVTISPNGSLTFNYTGSISGGDAPTLTAAGTMTDSFAIPVTQSASGTYQAVASNTLLNTSQMTGSQTISGGSPTATNGSLALTWGNGFALPTIATGASGTFSTSGAGALTPWYGGQTTYGVMSSSFTVSGGSNTSTGNFTYLTYYPTTGNLISQGATGNGSTGPYLNAVLASTTSSGQTTTSIYETGNGSTGSYTETSSPPYSSALFNGSAIPATMYLGGSGAIITVPITGSFNFTGTGASGSFPASSTGTASLSMFLGAVAGPAGGTQTGWGGGGAGYTPSGSSVFYSLGMGGPFTLGPASAYPGTLTVTSVGNTGTSPNGYPITVNGTWTQSDPPATGTTTAIAPWAAATGLTAPAQAWWLQRAAWLASPAAATAGAGANDPPLLSGRFTRLTGTSLGSRIQGAAQLTQIGTSGNPALAANLQAAWRFRREQQHRQAVLRAASGSHPRGPGS